MLNLDVLYIYIIYTYINPVHVHSPHANDIYIYIDCVYVISYTLPAHTQSDQIREVKDKVMHHKVSLTCCCAGLGGLIPLQSPQGAGV